MSRIYEPEFLAFLNACLPPLKDGRTCVVTSGYGPRNYSAEDRRSGGWHRAVDFIYVRPTPPRELPVHCPLSGTCTRAGGTYAQVLVRDAQNYSHEFLHMTPLTVKAGDSISAGQIIGYANGVGSGGRVHVHYQLRNPEGKVIDPEAFWAKKKQIFPAPLDDNNVAIHEATDTGYNQTAEDDGTATILGGYAPRQAGKAPVSSSRPAIWTNRVPSKEPWPRTLMGDTPNVNDFSEEYERNTSHNPQFTSDDEEGRKKIGIVDGDEEYVRGPFWRR